MDVTLAAAARARQAGALQLAAAGAAQAPGAQAPGAQAALSHPKLEREHRMPAQTLVALRAAQAQAVLRAAQALVASHPSLSMKKTPERSDSRYGVRCGTLGADACFSVASSVRSI